MSRCYAIIALLAASGALVACSVKAVPATPPAAASAVAPAAGEGAEQRFLYIAGGNGSGVLSQYTLDGSRPLRSVTGGGNFNDLVLDHSGRLIGIHAVSGISVFDARDLKLRKNSEATYPSSLAIDRDDNIYVANCGASVEVLYPGARKRAGWIRAQYGACIVAVSLRNDVYVVDGYGLIEVYRPQPKPGTLKLLRTIKDGLIDPDAIAFGPSGDLYVSNYPLYSGKGSIAVYGSNETLPKRTLTDGIDRPWALAVDSHGTLYVANLPQAWKRTDGWISIYGPAGEAPIGRIKEGINAPVAVAIDSSDNLYVANVYADDVSVYAGKGTHLIRRFRNGVKVPYALAVGN